MELDVFESLFLVAAAARRVVGQRDSKLPNVGMRELHSGVTSAEVSAKASFAARSLATAMTMSNELRRDAG